MANVFTILGAVSEYAPIVLNSNQPLGRNRAWDII